MRAEYRPFQGGTLERYRFGPGKALMAVYRKVTSGS